MGEHAQVRQTLSRYAIGVVIIVFSASWLFSVFHELNGQYKASDPATWLVALMCTFVVIGLGGCVLQALCAVGPLKLPPSYEWPVGYVRGVARTDDDKYIVPLSGCGRIQIYDSRRHFLRGWNVDAKGGTFRVRSSPNGVVEVYFWRGSISHRSYTEEGELLPPKDEQDPYRVAPRSGQSMIFPTPLSLWIFSSPILSSFLAFAGFMGLAAMGAFWARAEIQSLIVEVLEFLSSDKYSFNFVPLKQDRSLQSYFDFGDLEDWPFHRPDRVIMFSGGLDSLAGAVETAAGGGKVVLVSHRPVTTIDARQNTLFKEFQRLYPGQLNAKFQDLPAIAASYTLLWLPSK